MTKPLARDLFSLPKGVIYLDGNSLGPMPKTASKIAQEVIEHQWGDSLIAGWNKHGWIDLPKRVGNKIAKLIGAPPDSVIVGDTLSLRVYQAVAAALSLRASRRIILSDTGNFPTDLYMVEGLIKTKASSHRLECVPPEDIETAIQHFGHDLACLMVTEVDYRTGRRHNMARLIKLAHQAGAMVVWDLAHSAGAIPVELAASDVDFAAGCSYKFLNGGPGAPAFIYVRPDLIDKIECALSGWLGHAMPFAFEANYRPHATIDRMRIGTPAVIQMSILEGALGAWDGVSITDVHNHSLAMTSRFANIVSKARLEDTDPAVTLVTPMDRPEERGSQISFSFAQGYQAMQAMIASGIIGDYREPAIMRFGVAGLYNQLEEVEQAADKLCQIIRDKSYGQPRYQQRNAVT